MPESARFYVVNGKLDKAEKVIKTIAWFNCRDPPKVRVALIVGTFWHSKCYAARIAQEVRACLSVGNH